MTGTITTPAIGTQLFIYTNILMFLLRFCAGPIEHRLSPLGLLFCCAVIACIGLVLLGNATGVILCVVAVTVYGIGKTFFWPTMLAVVSERFPRGGALTLGTIGGIGMLSAGLLGAPGIGFQLDFFPAQELTEKAPKTLDRYADEQPKSFYGIVSTRGLDGTKVGLLYLAGSEETFRRENMPEKAKEKGEKLDEMLAELKTSRDPTQRQLAADWPQTLLPYVNVDYPAIKEATLFGTHMTLLWTAAVPATMAVLYLLLLGYFRLQGGYKRLGVSQEAEEKSAAAPWEG
jgi:MFS family permease